LINLDLLKYPGCNTGVTPFEQELLLNSKSSEKEIGETIWVSASRYITTAPVA
jgi:hypothetical protein